jgi:hypothetical protein
MGALRWIRGSAESEAALASVSLDGLAVPKVYFARDVKAIAAGANVDLFSEVVGIDGEEVGAWLEKEATHMTYHDPDARFNVLMARQASESPGTFVYPWFYPGANTTATFANGTDYVIQNYAWFPTKNNEWASVDDGESFYRTFVDPSTATTSSEKLKKRSVPQGYPDPLVKSNNEDQPLGGYFLNGTAYNAVAVLTMNTFDSEDSTDSAYFQGIVARFLAMCVRDKKTKIIIDISSNGGGSLLLGYDIFKQFFPSIEPDIEARMRHSDGLNIIGSAFGSISLAEASSSDAYQPLSAADMYTSSIHPSRSIRTNGSEFPSWSSLYGSIPIANDTYTSALRYNFSDPLLGGQMTISGYGRRANIIQPFEAKNIVLLHDGYCASTCAVFSDLMRRQGSVLSITLGGRQQFGPMQSVGGTKGALLLPEAALAAYTETVLNPGNRFASSADLEYFAQLLPSASGSAIALASPLRANFRNAYHPGDSTPMQFLNETANCRLFFTPEMVLDPIRIWEKVADVMWAQGGEDLCVAGSLTEGKAVGEMLFRDLPEWSATNGGGANGGSGGAASGSGGGTATDSAAEGRATSAGTKAGVGVREKVAAVAVAAAFVLWHLGH